MSVALFRNARIFTPEDEGKASAGAGQGELACWEKGALLCRDGRIEAVGKEPAVLAEMGAGSASEPQTEVDCGGRCMIPGFVDPHTHLCFTRPREKEFLARLEGADYLEILKAGGGILSSVSSVRAASEEELFIATRDRALSALRLGTTSVEIKSGYGLSTDAELRQLRVIARVDRETPISVVPTFLGAHAVPAELDGRTDEYTDLISMEMIPAVARQGLARFCDVFCEQGVFSAVQARRILEAARAAGLGLKMHADELHDTGAAGLAASLRAVSADHLLAASDEGLRAMTAAGVIAVLLPATAYSMRKPYARARAMIDMGLPVAIATDCNPGSSCTESMPFAFGLAVLQMRLSVAEALTAATLNAAYAISRGAETGSLAKGKAADFLLLDGETPGILAFRAGISPVAEVFKAGTRVWPSELDPFEEMERA
jgi:imidazolonepropionase